MLAERLRASDATSGHHRLPGRAARSRPCRRCAREAVGDEPFAVLLPDELMGGSSLLAQMNGVCAAPAAASSAQGGARDEVSRTA